MYVTRNQLVGMGLVIVLLAGAVAAKLVWYPSVEEKYFQLDYRKLEQAPAHALIVRPTHFGQSRRSGAFLMPFPLEGKRTDPNAMRGVGRNAPLAEVFAAAYQCQVAKVILPPLAPTNHYDFLVTASRHPVEQLRAAIKRQTGYTASWQQRSAEVLVVKVQGAGPAPSKVDRQNFNFNNGRLLIEHTSVQQVISMAQNQFREPLVDRTGLTGFYDFNIPWQPRNSISEAEAKQGLADMGFVVETDTVPMSMLVVEEAK
jgi:uncharacterized protein (TIGR03435 family)